MQQQNPVAVSSGKIAIRYGLIFGLSQTVIAAIATLLNVFVFSSNVAVIFVLDVLFFLTGIAAYFVAGILASKQTSKVSTGTISGLWTGVFSGIVGCIISIVIYFSISLPKLIDSYNRGGYPASAQGNIAAFKAGLVIAGAGLPILGLFLAIGVGAGIGALGGLLGRYLARKNAPAQLYQVPPYAFGQPYPGQPNPGQPYPGQPSFSQPQGPSYPGQPAAYTQPYAPKKPEPSEQPAKPSPTEWNPYNSDQPQ